MADSDMPTNRENLALIRDHAQAVASRNSESSDLHTLATLVCNLAIPLSDTFDQIAVIPPK